MAGTLREWADHARHRGVAAVFQAAQLAGMGRRVFFGETAESLAAEGDALTDRVAGTLREWADHARHRGVAAVFQAAQLAGMGRRVEVVTPKLPPPPPRNAPEQVGGGRWRTR